MKNITHLFLSLMIVNLLLTLNNVYAQTDTLKSSFETGVRGRWQTGNLDQLAINPNFNIEFSSNTFYSEIKADYKYLDVNGFIAIDDFWTHAIFKYHPNQRIYPIATINWGYSKSYRIKHSLISGVGAGINIYKGSQSNYLQTHVFVGHLNFSFQDKPAHTSLAFGTITKASFAVVKNIIFTSEIHTYH